MIPLQITSFFNLYATGILGIFIAVTILWLVSIPLKKVCIIDPFWSINFLILYLILFFQSEKSIITSIGLIMLTLWSLRLFLHLFIRNYGKEEDYRYQQFRQNYGPKRYWWFSYFQVFLLQGFIAIIVAFPLGGIFFKANHLGWIEYLGILLWVIGFIFESVGDYQLKKFKSQKRQASQILNTGLWKYSRHPNYFGNACIWWGFGIFGFSYAYWWILIGPLLMNFLLLNVSGVKLLEKSLQASKPAYQAYINKTNAFFPWFPKS